MKPTKILVNTKEVPCSIPVGLISQNNCDQHHAGSSANFPVIFADGRELQCFGSGFVLVKATVSLKCVTPTPVDQKPHDLFGVSLCRVHHDEQHRLGVEALDQKYGIDLWALANEFARRSPDNDMRATLKLVYAEEGRSH